MTHAGLLLGLYILAIPFIIPESFKSVAIAFPVVLMDLLLKKIGCVNELCTFLQVWSKIIITCMHTSTKL